MDNPTETWKKMAAGDVVLWKAEGSYTVGSVTQVGRFPDGRMYALATPEGHTYRVVVTEEQLVSRKEKENDKQLRLI